MDYSDEEVMRDHNDNDSHLQLFLSALSPPGAVDDAVHSNQNRYKHPPRN